MQHLRFLAGKLQNQYPHPQDYPILYARLTIYSILSLCKTLDLRNLV